MFSNIKAARFLGWTSIAVGVVEIAATRWLEEEMGIDDHEPLIRAFGAREIAAGMTILAQPGLNRALAGGLWSRVAGDTVDLAALGNAARSTRNPSGLSTITSLVLAITGIDILVALRVQFDLHRAAKVSRSARRRVQPTNAIPDQSNATNTPQAAASASVMAASI